MHSIVCSQRCGWQVGIWVNELELQKAFKTSEAVNTAGLRRKGTPEKVDREEFTVFSDLARIVCRVWVKIEAIL